MSKWIHVVSCSVLFLSQCHIDCKDHCYIATYSAIQQPLTNEIHILACQYLVTRQWNMRYLEYILCLCICVWSSGTHSHTHTHTHTHTLIHTHTHCIHNMCWQLLQGTRQYLFCLFISMYVYPWPTNDIYRFIVYRFFKTIPFYSFQ